MSRIRLCGVDPRRVMLERLKSSAIRPVDLYRALGLKDPSSASRMLAGNRGIPIKHLTNVAKLLKLEPWEVLKPITASADVAHVSATGLVAVADVKHLPKKDRPHAKKRESMTSSVNTPEVQQGRQPPISSGTAVGGALDGAHESASRASEPLSEHEVESLLSELDRTKFTVLIDRAYAAIGQLHGALHSRRPDIPPTTSSGSGGGDSAIHQPSSRKRTRA